MVSRGKKISDEVKMGIISALNVRGYSASAIARKYGVSVWSVYNLRKSYHDSASVFRFDAAPKHPFVELAVEEDRTPVLPKFAATQTHATLQKASFIFNKFSLSIEGSMSAAELCAMLKALEESC